MSIDRTEVAQTHFLKYQAATISATPVIGRVSFRGLQSDFVQRAFDPLLGFVGELEGNFAFWQAADEFLKILRPFIVRRIGYEFVEITGNSTDVFGDAPLVIIQNPNETLCGVANVV